MTTDDEDRAHDAELWEQPHDLHAMLNAVPDPIASERKLIYFAVACSRLTVGTESAADRRLSDAMQGFADAEVSRTQLVAAFEREGVPEDGMPGVFNSDEAQHYVSAALEGGVSEDDVRTLLRDVFGNPFRPVAFLPAWRSETVVALARGMYEARDFGPLPVLADALDDAGCDHPDILAHCRDPHQVHVRGCWVVDLVLDEA